MDEIRKTVFEIFRKVKAGDAPQQLIDLYKGMKPSEFSFWLHGFCCALSKDKEMRNSELVKFLREEMKHGKA